MRQTMRKRRHRIKKDRLFTIFAFFVVAPIISVLLGFALVKYMILPKFLSHQNEKDTQIMQDNIDYEPSEVHEDTQGIDNNQQSTESQNSPTKQTKLEGITLYNIQVGNFSTKENADSLVKQLMDNAIPGYVVQLDSYKVLSGTYFTREEADEYLSKVKNTYNDAFVNTFSIIERVVSYNEDELDEANNLIDTIHAFDNIYIQELSLLSKAMKSTETEELLSAIISNTENLEKKVSRLDVELKSKQLVQTRDKLKSLITQRKTITEGLKNSSNKSLNKFYTDFHSNYFEYVSFTKSELKN